MRQSWNTYFMNIAHTVKERATCNRRKVGAVIVKDNQIISTGYNGAPKGLAHCIDNPEFCIRQKMGTKSGKGLDLCRAVHSEQNALLQASKLNVNTEDCKMYVTLFPCVTCAKLIVQSGIKEVYYSEGYPDTLSECILKEGRVKLIQMEV